MIIIKIGGCTGVGKTDIALKLKESYNIHLISCDSVQIYKELDIATNKPDDINSHKLLNIASIKNPFDVTKYIKNVEHELKYCIEHNKIPVIVGGTGFYMDKIVSKHNSFTFFITQNRTDLFRKTDRRCEEMVMNGLLYEVISLKRNGVDTSSIPGKAIGYRDAFIFIDNICDDENKNISNFLLFLKNFQRRTRNYIRKQETWFKSKDCIWINKDKYNPVEIIKMVIENNNELVDLDLREINGKSRVVNCDANKKLKTYVSKITFMTEERIKNIIDGIRNEIENLH